MTLSNQVKEAVQQSKESLRDALAFAARGEHPIVISMLSDILTRLDSLETMEDFMDKFSVTKEKNQA